jgi:hypothetical protein
MKLFLTRYKYSILITAIYLLGELIVNPLGEFPLNDDWSYTKTAKILLEKGDLNLGAFCAMTLVSHVAWGFLFIKSLGFSFFALRLSSLVSSLIGLLILNKLVFSISKNHLIAFIASLTLLLNPIYFNLSNTYMTDINFNTLMLVAFYFAWQFFETRKSIYFVLVFVLSALLVLCRQFGIVFPFCFALACLFSGEKKWLNFSYAILGSLIVFGIFKWYESFLHRMLPEYASYITTSNKISITDSDLTDRIIFNLSNRFNSIVLVMLVYAAPLAILFYRSLFSTIKPLVILIITILNVLLITYCFTSTNFLFGNIFMTMTVGPDTFFDNGHAFLQEEIPGSAGDIFKITVFYLKLFFATIVTTVISLALFKAIKDKSSFSPFGWKPFGLLLFLVASAYLLLLFTPDSFFDRYTLSLITASIIGISFIPHSNFVKARYSVPLLLIFAYAAVMGTKDYFTLNKTRWEAVNLVKKETNASIRKINAGFEVNCWDDGSEIWWANYLDLKEYDYLIQYNNAPSFVPYKTFEFQRYFPYKKDRLTIFVRDTIKTQ